MKLKFTKMQGAGNDFVVVDATQQALNLTTQQISFMANRQFGIGCDQLLMVEKTSTPQVDFRYRIFNADGGEVEQCGNGARCFVRFVIEKGLTQKREITVETASGVITLKLEDNNQVTVNMGAPKFEPAEIPFIADTLINKRAPSYQLNLVGPNTENFTQQIFVVSMGNPHAVQIVADVDSWPVGVVGPLIEHHARFPQRVNAGFMQILNLHHIKLRVFERGSGETLSCGTGACAAVVSGVLHGVLQSPVKVSTHGGELSITWEGEGSSVFMTGPAAIVFDGEIELIN